ncbi:amidohydrolase family protein, partial [Mycobacteriaceae bacterium Msp059]|nr:amidohydrolase family protein [Mycobacteriaceae bacterium Msp059]
FDEPSGRGTIRVNPDDIVGALREIDKYKDHPRVVQIGIPMQSRELYGKPQFWPLWEAAAEAGLPVAVHIEGGAGIQFAPTPSGKTRTYEQYLGFMALNYIYHLMNMIAEGV